MSFTTQTLKQLKHREVSQTNRILTGRAEDWEMKYTVFIFIHFDVHNILAAIRSKGRHLKQKGHVYKEVCKIGFSVI